VHSRASRDETEVCTTYEVQHRRVDHRVKLKTNPQILRLVTNKLRPRNRWEGLFWNSKIHHVSARDRNQFLSRTRWIHQSTQTHPVSRRSIFNITFHFPLVSYKFIRCLLSSTKKFGNTVYRTEKRIGTYKSTTSRIWDKVGLGICLVHVCNHSKHTFSINYEIKNLLFFTQRLSSLLETDNWKWLEWLRIVSDCMLWCYRFGTFEFCYQRTERWWETVCHQRKRHL
jgi:hypothetical protein